MRSYFRIRLLVLLIQSVFSLKAMEPESLFKLATNKYIETYKKNYSDRCCFEIARDLSSGKVPDEIVERIVRVLKNNRDSFYLLDRLLDIEKFEPLHSRMLDRMMTISVSKVISVPNYYFELLLVRNPINKVLTNLMIEKYTINLSEIAENVVCLNQPCELEKLIKEFGLNVNVRTNTNGELDTLLHSAALIDPCDCGEILLKNGALPNLKDKNGYTPLDIAFDRDNKKMILLLQQYGAKTNRYVPPKIEQLNISNEEDDKKTKKENNCITQ